MGRKLLSVKEILVGFIFRQKEKSTRSFSSDFHALPVRSQCCGLGSLRLGSVYEVIVAAHGEEVFYVW